VGGVDVAGEADAPGGGDVVGDAAPPGPSGDGRGPADVDVVGAAEAVAGGLSPAPGVPGAALAPGGALPGADVPGADDVAGAVLGGPTCSAEGSGEPSVVTRSELAPLVGGEGLAPAVVHCPRPVETM
jgi:hypothetical protein